MEQKNHELTARVLDAQKDSAAFDALVSDYAPFIRAEVSKAARKYGDNPTRGVYREDEWSSVGLMAFYEAVRGYNPSRGPFILYARLLLEKRVLDELRRKHREEKLVPVGEGQEMAAHPLLSALTMDNYRLEQNRAQLSEELALLGGALESRGITLDDVYRDAPKHAAARARLDALLGWALRQPDIVDCILHKRYVPMAALQKCPPSVFPKESQGIRRKMLERHRRYLIACMLVYGGDYPCLRAYLPSPGAEDKEE